MAVSRCDATYAYLEGSNAYSFSEQIMTTNGKAVNTFVFVGGNDWRNYAIG